MAQLQRGAGEAWRDPTRPQPPRSIIAVDFETNEVVSREVLIDDLNDVKAFKGLLEKAEKRRRVFLWLGDGAYDSGVVFEMLGVRGIEPVIKLRRNSRLDTRSLVRRRVVKQFRDLGYYGWAEEKGYGIRWMVEHRPRARGQGRPIQHAGEPVKRDSVRAEV